MVFYQERVPGSLEAMAQDKNTMAAGEAEPKKASKEGEDATVKHPAGRPFTVELKELLRLLDVKLSYDPDRKEGTLDFFPFQ